VSSRTLNLAQPTNQAHCAGSAAILIFTLHPNDFTIAINGDRDCVLTNCQSFHYPSSVQCLRHKQQHIWCSELLSGRRASSVHFNHALYSTEESTSSTSFGAIGTCEWVQVNSVEVNSVYRYEDLPTVLQVFRYIDGRPIRSSN